MYMVCDTRGGEAKTQTKYVQRVKILVQRDPAKGKTFGRAGRVAVEGMGIYRDKGNLASCRTLKHVQKASQGCPASMPLLALFFFPSALNSN